MYHPPHPIQMHMSSDPTVSAFPDGDNLFHWVATIVGGKGTAYDGLKFKLSLTFPSRYPYTPPIVKFVTPCYHPNVDNHGNICLDILKVTDYTSRVHNIILWGEPEQVHAYAAEEVGHGHVTYVCRRIYMEVRYTELCSR